MAETRDVAIIGIGKHPFGRFPGIDGIQMGAYAAREALKDADLEWKDIQVAYGGSYDGGSPDAMVKYLGLTGIQFTTIRNACATGGACAKAAADAILAGSADIAMAVGIDKHPRGAFALDPSEITGIGKWYGEIGLSLTTQFFGMKINKYMHDYGITTDTLIKVILKSRRNAALTPTAWRREPMTYDEIANSIWVNPPLRQYMFCSPNEGAAALILCSPDIARRYTTKPVWLRTTVVKTHKYDSFEVLASCQSVKYDTPSPTIFASQAAYEMVGIGPRDIDIAQIQDTEAGAEIMHMAECGFCQDGEQNDLINEGVTEINGRLPINTDGGCLANGEPTGASGIRQIHEVVMQLRGDAGPRQVPKPLKTGLTHVYGGPGISAVNILTN